MKSSSISLDKARNFMATGKMMQNQDNAEKENAVKEVKPVEEIKPKTTTKPQKRISPTSTNHNIISTNLDTENKAFDLSSPDVIFPKRAKRGEKIAHKYASVYLPEDEFEILEQLAEKHRMTASNLIRVLIINSK